MRIPGRINIRWMLVGLLLLSMEPALANKFETIGGGVSGLSQEKIEILQTISAIAGCFLIFLGAMALLTRKRFESFAAVYTGKKGDSVNTVPLVLIVFGCVLIGLYFL